VRQSAVGRVEEATAAGGSKAKEDLSNVQGEFTMMKEEVRRLQMITARQLFPPSMKEGRLHLGGGKETYAMYDIPDGIIAHLTRECGGNVHDHHVVDVTCKSFEMETVGVNPHSGAFNNDPDFVAKNAADFETDSCFGSAHRWTSEHVPHTRNNWVCYDFKERRIVPTNFAIRTNWGNAGEDHLKSWLVETSVDGENWREVAREQNNEELNGGLFTGTFAVAGGRKCRFIRLVQIGKNHFKRDQICITAWEIFGSLIE
jgi:hypothetical protein